MIPTFHTLFKGSANINLFALPINPMRLRPEKLYLVLHSHKQQRRNFLDVRLQRHSINTMGRLEVSIKITGIYFLWRRIPFTVSLTAVHPSVAQTPLIMRSAWWTTPIVHWTVFTVFLTFILSTLCPSTTCSSSYSLDKKQSITCLGLFSGSQFLLRYEFELVYLYCM